MPVLLRKDVVSAGFTVQTLLFGEPAQPGRKTASVNTVMANGNMAYPRNMGGLDRLLLITGRSI
jgi:hypothetical protein